jgi:membrane protease YdiL (CAAX protease family)
LPGCFVRRLREAAARRPALFFVLATVAWSYALWSFLFLFIEPGGLALASADDPPPPPVVYALVLAGGAGPSLAGVLTTALVDGGPGLASLGRRLRNWRGGGPASLIAALLLIPSVAALTPLARWAAGYPQSGGAMLSRLGPGVALGVAAGLMEELGWRGFLLPRLLYRDPLQRTLPRLSPLASALLVGLVWGLLWHGYADFFGVGGKGGGATLLLILLLGPVLLGAWSLLLTLLYLRADGGLLLSVVMHASISSSALVFAQSYDSLPEEVAWTAASSGIAVAASSLIWALTMNCCPPPPPPPACEANAGEVAEGGDKEDPTRLGDEECPGGAPPARDDEDDDEPDGA